MVCQGDVCEKYWARFVGVWELFNKESKGGIDLESVSWQTGLHMCVFPVSLDEILCCQGSCPQERPYSTWLSFFSQWHSFMISVMYRDGYIYKDTINILSFHILPILYHWDVILARNHTWMAFDRDVWETSLTAASVRVVGLVMCIYVSNLTCFRIWYEQSFCSRFRDLRVLQEIDIFQRCPLRTEPRNFSYVWYEMQDSALLCALTSHSCLQSQCLSMEI